MSPEDAEELERLRAEVAALGGDPNAVLARANRPTASAPRQGRTEIADVSFGDVTTEAPAEHDLGTLEGSGAYEQEMMAGELRGRRNAETLAAYREALDNGFDLPPIPKQAQPVRQPVDFDERQADELRAMAAYGTTDQERQANIRRELESATMIGDSAGVARYRPSAGGFATELNVDPETGRTIGNISEDEVRRALQRREELFL